MMRESGAVRFSKQGVTVTLSDAALDAMALTDDSRFFIEMERTDQGFALIAELDGIPLTALPDTAVFLPFAAPADSSRLSLQNEQGETVCEGTYDPALGVASFTIQSAGRYTVVEIAAQDETPTATDTQISDEPPMDTEEPAVEQAPEQEAEPEQSLLLLPVAVVALVLAAGVLLLWRRWRR